MKLWADSMASDLPILNAELYAGVHLIGEIGKAKNARAAQGDDGPRKRARKSPVRVIEARGLDDGGEKAKRGRGRPKLDTKDQSATEVGSLLLPNAVFWIVRIVVSFCCMCNVSMEDVVASLPCKSCTEQQ